MLTRDNLHQYQRDAIAFTRAKRRCALWLGLGLGKSCSSLTAISDMTDEFEIRKTLVVAPLRVAVDTWPNEVRKWSHLKHLRVSVMVGNDRKRRAALRAEADIYVINVENLPWLENVIGLGGPLPWEMIVIDESSAFKNRDTQRFKTMRRLSARADRVLQLTATPASNSYLELWPQTYILDRGQRLGETFTGYKQRYFSTTGYENRTFVLKKGAKEAIHSRIADITMTMKSRDYLDMPKQLPPIDVSIILSDEEMALYERMEKDFVLEVADVEIEAINASALTTKLAQLANGRVYDADKTTHQIHNAKIEALKELQAESGDEPLLVAYAYQSDRDAIVSAFTGAEVIEKNSARLGEQLQRWNRKEIPMLVVHPASAGHGLNLQYGGSILIFYGLTWSLELYLQLIGRLDRQGQTEPVRVYRLITKNTIDEEFAKVLEGKESRQDALLNAMKVRVDNLR